jgi:hypothetical protein
MRMPVTITLMQKRMMDHVTILIAMMNVMVPQYYVGIIHALNLKMNVQYLKNVFVQKAHIGMDSHVMIVLIA